MPQNQTLIGCLDKVGQDEHLKLSPQNHILKSLSWYKEHSSGPTSWGGQARTKRANLF